MEIQQRGPRPPTNKELPDNRKQPRRSLMFIASAVAAPLELRRSER